MYELMSEFKPVHVMELPNSQSERGLVFWKSEIIRTKEYLEEFFHIVITEEPLRIDETGSGSCKGGRYPEDGAGE